MPLARAGLVAILVLLALPGTSIAGSASESTRTKPNAHAGMLQLGAGYAADGEAPRVRALQRKLRALGWRPGRVDGLFGPRTEGAVAGFQEAAGLRADGIVGPHTQRALERASRSTLQRGSGYTEPAGSPRVRRLQRELRRAGLNPGPVDGLFGPRTEAAVTRLQRNRGLRESGVVDAGTRRVLATAGDPAGDRRARPADRPSGDRDRTAPTAIERTGAEPAGPGGEWLVLTALLALALGALAGTLARRPRVGPAAATPTVSLARGVVAEGVARAASIGRFRGQVHALVLSRQGRLRTQDARFLISDPDKEVPFWVDQQEVARLLDPEQERSDDPEQQPDDPEQQPDDPAQQPRDDPGQQPPDDPEHDPPAAATTPEPPAPPPASPAQEAPADIVRALGYVSVPTNGDPAARAMREQATEIDSLCEERGWHLVEVVRDVDAAGGAALRRPGLAYAVGRIAKGEVSCLVVSELSRLSSSAAELSRVLELLARGRGRLVVMDVGLDTASEPGRIAANSLLRVGSWERRRVLENTRRGLAAARARRAAGQPAVEDVPELKQRIVDMRADGMTLQAIADQLNEEGVPTMRGGQKWRPSSVQAAVGYRRPRRRDVVHGPREGGANGDR